jgi:hypothetical protein
MKMQLLAYFLLSSLLWISYASEHHTYHSSSPSQGRGIEDHKEIQLDFHQLRKLPLSFPHIWQLVKSIDQKLQKFHVHELIDLSPTEGTSSAKNLNALNGNQPHHKNSHMRSTTTYEFYDRNAAFYHNIDSFKSQEFKSFSSSHMVHCSQELEISSGAYLVGTKAGPWYQEAKVRMILLFSI